MIKALATSIFDYVKVSFWLFCCIFAVAFAAPLLGEIEGRFFPVARDFTVSRIKADDGTVSLAGTMQKVRDCQFIELIAYVGTKKSIMPKRERLDIEFQDQPADVSATRLPGWQAWGDWVVTKPSNVAGPDVWLEVRHRCHALWETVTALATIEAHRLFGAERDIMDLYAAEN